jgi:hypothetical protein
MNEIVYNILRKCVECPDKVECEYSSGYYSWEFWSVKVSGVLVLKVQIDKSTGTHSGVDKRLTDKECRRILRGMEYVEAMKIRGL